MNIDYRGLVGLCLIALVTVKCAGITEPSTKTGDVSVSITTVGIDVDFDLDGYVLTIDGTNVHLVDANTIVSYSAISSGSHVLKLDGVAANCSVSGGAEQSVNVAAASVSSAAFHVTCIPNTGSIRVTTQTLGADPDFDGYIVYAGGLSAHQAANGEQVISEARVGNIGVTLVNVAGNCVVETPIRMVKVTFHTTVDVSFVIRCVQAGSIRITTSTTGVDINPEGYRIDVRPLELDQSSPVGVPLNGSAVIANLMPGSYELTLSQIQPNCHSSLPTSNVVRVEGGVESLLALVITCVATTPIAYVSGDGADAEIFSVQSNGTGSKRLTFQPGADTNPAWSPDGTRIAFASWRDGHEEVYVMNADGSNPVRLTSDASLDYAPTWSPDGSRIAFVSTRDGIAEIYAMNADGSNLVRLTSNNSYDANPSWSPDGSKIAFESNREGTGGIWVMNADGSNAVRLTSNAREDLHPAWSPDGTTIAFSRGGASNARDIFIMSADGTNTRQVSNDFPNATKPSWSPDGRNIAFGTVPSDCGGGFYYYYYDCDPRITVVSIDGTMVTLLNTVPPSTEPAWRR